MDFFYIMGSTNVLKKQ